ncbi:hypothetical protein ACIOD2_39670 [Amycolatopsis sp. NPDC088138]|uniref:hypothetical protein n=1 Tax=Amycolatopsis sp. NPDC088138 TaxID=3363938 RepID=UPI003803C51F
MTSSEDDETYWSTTADEETTGIAKSGSRPEVDGATMLATLHSGIPVILAMRPYQNAAAIPALIRQLAAHNKGKVTLGAIAPLNHIKPDDPTEFLPGCTGATLKIADPVTYLFHGDNSTKKKPTKVRWPYQTSSTDEIKTDSWAESVGQAQRDVGANLILSPGNWKPAEEAEVEINLEVEQFEAISKQSNDKETCALNLTLGSTWLTQERTRDTLLESIVATQPAAVYMRVLWPKLAHNYASLSDVSILKGYKEICETLSQEDIPLLLPDTDLTGWYLLAFGATGFGTGVTSGARAFKPDQAGGAGAPRKPRYFQPGMLHTVLKTEQTLIESTISGTVCSCPYCAFSRSTNIWTPAAEGGHHLNRISDLTSDISNRKTRRASAKSTIIKAAEFTANVMRQIPLESNSQPSHLSQWEQLF